MGDNSFTAKSSKERYDEYQRLRDECLIIENHRRILVKDISYLQASQDELQNLTALCQCETSDVDQQLANNEIMLTELRNKFNKISTIKLVDICVNRLPSNWEEVMLNIDTDKSNNDMIGSSVNDKIEINNNQNLKEKRFTDNELMAMHIKTIKDRIDIAKQLIEVALRLKREYESSNSNLNHKSAVCHCKEDDARDDIELEKYLEERTSNCEKKQHYIPKKRCNAANYKCFNNREMKESSIETTAKTKNGDKLTTTIERVDSLEEVVSDNHLKRNCEHKHQVTVNECSDKQYVYNGEETSMNGLVIECINNKNEYKCPVDGCDYVCLTFSALATHSLHEHRRKMSAFLDTNVSINTDNDDNIEDENNENLVYDQIIPLFIPKKNRPIKLQTNSQ